MIIVFSIGTSVYIAKKNGNSFIALEFYLGSGSSTL